ncbi:MAG: aromatic amino acid hydroxylase [Bdellovibrionales bacterium]|nr:aromatic amino acid hydroxylase [Bdellovibrionales bacterium]
MKGSIRPITERIPEHLASYIVEQDPSMYTAIDHASWRFIMRISRAFFVQHAHRKYLDGLKETGISSDRIPLISEMDECLKRFGWRAVAVSGFIPPSAFMEFQSLGVLPIACDMRKLENLAYTPAPDIVHEAAGHAPILSDPEYATYLRHYGEVSRKAIYSSQDLAVYQAIRNLSEVKENPQSTGQEIEAAQSRLNAALAEQTYASEATLLARMNWWTVEYGLIGPLESPKIYGAGLLSSVGESYNFLSPSVAKIPLTVGCVNVPYDITRPQPQLFVTPNFSTLSRILDEFSETMGFRIGGMESLRKAIKSNTVTTTELDTGLQVGGKLIETISDSLGNAAYLRYDGPCQLAYKGAEIEDQGTRAHSHGFGTPIGQIVWNGSLRSPASLSDADLSGITEVQFESNVRVQGKIIGNVRRDGRVVIIRWEGCTVKLNDRVLFQPDWGVFDMACGSTVDSVFGGPPDMGRYLITTEESPRRKGFQKTNLTDDNLGLNKLYEIVRKVRDRGQREDSVTQLSGVFKELEVSHPQDWLLRLELLELEQLWKLAAHWRAPLLARLAEIARSNPEVEKMIRRGMELIA